MGYVILVLSIFIVHFVSIPVKKSLLSAGYSHTRSEIESVVISLFLCLLAGFVFIVFLNSME